jgi:hypothetical protein
LKKKNKEPFACAEQHSVIELSSNMQIFKSAFVQSFQKSPAALVALPIGDEQKQHPKGEAKLAD